MFDRELQPNAAFEYSKALPDETQNGETQNGETQNGGNLDARLEQSVAQTARVDSSRVESFSAPISSAEIVGEDVNSSNQDESLSEVTEHAEDIEDEGTACPPAERSSGISYGTTVSGTLRYAEFEGLFREWRKSGDPSLRDRLILMNRGLVIYLARRFAERGEMSEDLMQQGLIGLINALDSFDPDRGARFVTFATPTILGEMRRYLRDRSWSVRVPRHLHELNTVINQRIEALTQQFDRSPTYAEIARSLGLDLEQVIEALELFNTAEPVSLDEIDSDSQNEDGTPISEQMGALDADLESLNDHSALRSALDQLEPRERRVLELVYFQGYSQLAVARQMKVSQMNISRLQRRALAHLRELMSSGDL